MVDSKHVDTPINRETGSRAGPTKYGVARCADIKSIHNKGNERHLLREIVRTHQVMMVGFTRVVGMPASRFALMRLLAAALPEDIGIMDLARQLGINVAAVTRQIKQMQSEGLVLRRTDRRDKRRSYVRLSAKGCRTFKEIHRGSHELEDMLASIISVDDFAVTVTVLTRLRELIEQLMTSGKGEIVGQSKKTFQ